MPLPDLVPSNGTTFDLREDVFSYGPPTGGAFEWHVNFADPNLFVAYGSQLLAQDELQVLEHPVLASLRELLAASDDPLLRPITDEDDAPTPVLIRGVERRCALATDVDLLEGRPLGLYGSAFARATEKTIARAVTVLVPPTISNLIAMAAPLGGEGRYTEAEIHRALWTAFTAFRAAVVDARAAGAPGAVVVHTGHWGTGAFGGNRVLMAILQRLAARIAGVDRLVFHTVDATGVAPVEEATRRLSVWAPERSNVELADVLRAVHATGFVWGTPDGN